MNPFDLTGTTALVSGSSRGIGRALAKGLLQAGSRVTIHGRNIDQVKTTPSTAESPTSSRSGERLTSWSTTPAFSAVPRSPSSRCRTGMTSLSPT
jgi:gluconate 5-dehydrogenase